MNVGDRVRVKAGPAGRDVLGVPADQVGTIRDIDATCDRLAVLISFPDVDLYTSALCDEDVEIVREGDARVRKAG